MGEQRNSIHPHVSALLEAAVDVIAQARRLEERRRRDPECSMCGSHGPHDWSCPIRSVNDAIEAFDGVLAAGAGEDLAGELAARSRFA